MKNANKQRARYLVKI